MAELQEKRGDIKLLQVMTAVTPAQVTAGVANIQTPEKRESVAGRENAPVASALFERDQRSVNTVDSDPVMGRTACRHPECRCHGK